MKDTEQIDLPDGRQRADAPRGQPRDAQRPHPRRRRGPVVTVILTFRRAAPLTVTVPVVSFDDLAARIGS